MDRIIRDSAVLTITARKRKTVDLVDGRQGYQWVGQPRQYAVSIEVNVTDIMRLLADRAALSKSGRATAFHGRIKVKAIGR